MKRSIKLCAALLLGGCLWAAPAGAHSIFVFAYPEDAQICTNSYFGGKAKVRGGEVKMMAADGEVLATASTDENGDACFPKPAAQDLLFKVTASGGHQGEFWLPTTEKDPYVEAIFQEATQGMFADSPEHNPLSIAAPCATGLTVDDLNKAVAPLMIKLAEMESAQNSRVSLRDIVGGLGWLIGLAGTALWAQSRKKRG